MSGGGLTDSQKKRVGTYFARNYDQGKLVEIPKKDEDSWHEWMEKKLVEIGFYDEGKKRKKKTSVAPPRIFLRKDSLKEEEKVLRTKKSKFNKASISDSHYEFKVWLQHKVEEARIGLGSLRILASEGADSEFDEYDRSFKLLSNGIESLFNSEIMKVGVDSKAISEATRLNLMLSVLSEIEGRDRTEIREICEATVQSLISTSHTRLPENREIFDHRDRTDNRFIQWAEKKLEEEDKAVKEEDVEEELERIFTRDNQFPRDHPENNNYAYRFEKRIYNKNRVPGADFDEQRENYRNITKRRLTKQRLSEEGVEPEEDWNWVEITCPAIVIIPDLSRRINQILSRSIENLSRARESPEGKEYIGNLDEKSKEYIDEIVQDGLRTVALSKDITAEEATTHFSRKMAYNIITMLQNDGLLTTRSMEESEVFKQLFNGDESRYDKYILEKGYQNMPNVYRFTDKLLDLFHEVGDHEGGKVTYSHFSRKDEHKKKMENAIFRYLRTTRSRWMYCVPEEHEAGVTSVHDLSSRMLKDIEERGFGNIILTEVGEEPIGLAERKEDTLRIEGGFIIRERDGRRTEMYKDRDDYEGFEVKVDGVNTDSRRCRPDKATTDSLNALQSVQWEINLDFLVKLFDIEFDSEEEDEVEDMEAKESTEDSEDEMGDNKEEMSGVEYLKKTGKLIENITAREELLASGNKEHESFFDDESSEEMITTLDWIKKIVNHNANVFWHAWYCDFRGRLYPRCPGLSPVGGDLDKALIRFKKWKPLGKESDDNSGINWFRCYLHNLMEGLEGPWKPEKRAKKGISFEARQKWVIEHENSLMEMGRNPLSDKNREWLGLNKPKAGKEDLQRIAALIEFDRIMREYNNQEEKDWSKIESGHPVSLDGSCNGYQHISTLLRNPNLAKSVNVIPKSSSEEEDKVMGDLYERVARKAKETDAAAELEKTLMEGLTNEAEKDESEAKRLANEILERVFSRKVAKKPTMTRAYGSTSFHRALAGKNQQGAIQRSLPQRRVFDKKEKEERNEINQTSPKFENSWFEYQQNPYTSKNKNGIRQSHFAKHVKKKRPDGELKDILKRHTKGYTRGEKKALLLKYGIERKDNGRRYNISNLDKEKRIKIINGEKSITESAYIEWKDKENRDKLIKEGEKWGDKFREEETFQLWAPGSGLHSALSSSDELWGLFRYSKESPIKGSGILWKMQPEITILVNKAYSDGIDTATNMAYKKFEKMMKQSLESSQGKYPGVRWTTKSRIDSDEVGFEVSNYYIKTDDKGGRGGWPTKPDSCYSNMGSIPDWYSEKEGDEDSGNFSKKPFTRARIIERINRFIKESEGGDMDEISYHLNRNDDLNRDLALTLLEKKDGVPGASEIAKICKALFGHISIVIPQYIDHEFDMINVYCKDGVKKCGWKGEKKAIETFDKDEREKIKDGLLEEIGECSSCGSNDLKTDIKEGRLDYKAAKRGVCPNFIHSLDACHMRTAINQFRTKVEEFGFFAVHDSFGTHACDVEDMRDTVVRTFWEMHKDRDIDYWISNLEGPQGKITLEGQNLDIEPKDLKEFKDNWNNSEYLIS